MFLHSASLAVLIISFIVLVFLPTRSHSIPCEDDPGYTFGRQRRFGRRVIRTCDWLRNAGNFERNYWCFNGRKFHDHITVAEKCPETCGQCAAIPAGCDNYPANWKDEIGTGCWFYEQGDNCNIWGNGYPDPDTGYTAKDACCACGGGCLNRPVGWVDSEGNGCDWYAQDPSRSCPRFGSSNRNRGFVANEACCVCGGGELRGLTRLL